MMERQRSPGEPPDERLSMETLHYQVNQAVLLAHVE
jgi:hypothetical protein